MSENLSSKKHEAAPSRKKRKQGTDLRRAGLPGKDGC